MADWIKVNLGELAAEGRSVISGPFGSDIGTQFFKSEGVPVIRGNNLTKDHRRLVDDGFVFVTEDKADDLDAYAVEDDLIFTAAGTIGQVGLIPEGSRFEKYVISNKQIRFRADLSKVDLDYLYAWLSSPWIFRAIENRDTGSTVPLINLSVVRSLPVSLPKSGAEQRKIGRIFRAIDAKIELNNRINAELEALAKMIYDYWFVQFDFPDAHGRPYKSSGGAMVWNDTLKREIPAGWEAGVLSDIAKITMGQSPAGDSYNEEGRGAVFFQGSTDFGARSPNVRMYTTSPGRMAWEGDILVSVRAPVGTLNIADRTCCIGRGLAALHSKNGFDGYLHRVLADLKQIFDRRSSEGTTFGSINKDDLFGLRVLIPDVHALRAYERMACNWIRMAALRDKESREFTQLRDWLLPLLMNGQVRVA